MRVDLPSVQKVEDEAAAWLAKRDVGPWTDEDQAMLERWLNSSTAHVVAFVRLESAWQRLHRLKSLGAGIPHGRVPSPDDWRLSPIFRGAASGSERQRDRKKHWRVLPWAIAAGALMALAGGVRLLDTAPSSFRTPVGGTASVPLPDGSMVLLNTETEIRLALTDKQRHVELRYGEAFFRVAPDPDRPFVVKAENKRIVAIGTAFSVRREGANVRVVVTEGQVRVEDGDQGGVLLSAGDISWSGRNRMVLDRRPPQEAEEALSWREGFLTFRDTSVIDAVAEFNRYNHRKIVIENPALGAIRLSGKFRPTQYEAFIRLLEDSFSVRALHEADRIVLTAR